MNSTENLANVFSFAENSTEKLWEAILVTLGSVSWTQEQIENMFKNFMEQGKVSREQSLNMSEKLVEQARKNQQQMQQMIQEAVLGAFNNLDIPTFSYISDLTKKIDDLAQRVDNLQSS
ncbi:MAG: phasin family protein [Syntrophomonadaceae bacterium]|jgi:polyhydroxyalkanoate synthesis regulator phasin